MSPIALVLAISLLDVALPSILWAVDKQTPLTDVSLKNPGQSQILGFLFYCIFYIFTIFIAAGGKSSKTLTQSADIQVFSTRRIKGFVGVAIFFYSVWLGLEAANAGGFNQWLINKAVQRWVGGTPSEDVGSLLSLLRLVPWSAISAFLAFIIFFGFEINEGRRKWVLYSFAFALCAAGTTFFRGAFAELFVGYLLCYQGRMFLKGVNIFAFRRIARLSILLVITSAIFIGFGQLRETAKDEDDRTDNSAVNFIRQGSGLEGNVAIVDYFGINVPYFWGKTYWDMMLLPVPRIIYSSKPEWYGIDDISRRMGRAESTQSAVTIPGEAYANFGPLGLLLALPFGLLLRVMSRTASRIGAVNFFIYLAIGPHIILVTNWMSFTGFMNSVPVLVLLLLISAAVCGSKEAGDA